MKRALLTPVSNHGQACKELGILSFKLGVGNTGLALSLGAHV